MIFLKELNKVAVLLFSILVFACSSDAEVPIVTNEETENPVDDTTDEESTDSKPNILLIIADDMGLDATPGYDIGTIKPAMPNLEDMMRKGLTFNNLWSNPTCTPTRSAMITGKYGFRTNVSKVGDELSLTETSLQQYIDQNTSSSYSSAVIGKWHLSNDINHPNNMGIPYFGGFSRGGVSSYTNWDFVENGTTILSNTYATTKFTDVAIDWIGDQSKPWFLWLAFNAPHTPFHLPPTELHNQGALPEDEASIEANPTPYYMAALEAMDTEIGRLLGSMTDEERDNTVILFIGDNGTPAQVSQVYGTRRTKDSAYQGGVNVPMVISGNGVVRVNETEDALITVTDLFSTISQLAGIGVTELHDSKSFKPLLSAQSTDTREFAYTEIGRDGGTYDVAIRNQTHKYITFSDGSEELYNLIEDPLENESLLTTNTLSSEDSIELAKLKDELIRLKQ